MRPLRWCVAGLLLVLAEARAFGVDLANDTLGYLVVAAACHRLSRVPGASWAWTAAGLCAVAAFAVSLVAFGGPLTAVLPEAHRLWTVVVVVEILAEAGMFAGVGLARYACWTAGRGRPRAWVCGALAASLCGLAVVSAVLTAVPGGYVGWVSVVRRAAGGAVGMMQLAVVLVAFAVPGSRDGVAR